MSQTTTGSGIPAPRIAAFSSRGPSSVYPSVLKVYTMELYFFYTIKMPEIHSKNVKKIQTKKTHTIIRINHRTKFQIRIQPKTWEIKSAKACINGSYFELGRIWPLTRPVLMSMSYIISRFLSQLVKLFPTSGASVAPQEWVNRIRSRITTVDLVFINMSMLLTYQMITSHCIINSRTLLHLGWIS